MRDIRGLRGVTLIELAVVMAIVAIMALFMAPAIGEWIENFRIRQGAREIASALQEARIKAVSRRMQYGVNFNVASDQYQLWVNDGGWGPDPEEGVLRVPRGVDIAGAVFGGATATRPVFNPDGTSDQGDVTINNTNGRQFQISVSPLGRVSIQ